MESLPDRYTQFKVNYNMNKLDMSPIELMHKLKSAECAFKKQGGAHIAESSSVKPKWKPKGGNKKKKKKKV